MHFTINFILIYVKMQSEFQTLPEDKLYTLTMKDAGINWASPLDIIAAASEESSERGVVPFSFISDIRGINTYFQELKLVDEKRNPESRLLSDRIIFEYNGKDYVNSQDVSNALNSEFLRRIQNKDNKPSYYQVSPLIKYKLNDLADSTKRLLIPAGIGFCEKFGCDRDGRLLYPGQD